MISLAFVFFLNFILHATLKGIGWTGENTTVSQNAKGKIVRIYMNGNNQPKALVCSLGKMTT